jgi:hypothetical protein
MEIVDLLNSGEVEIFEYNDYYKEDKSLIDFTSYRISIASPISYPNIDEIDVLGHYISQMKSDIRNHIDKKLIEEFNTSYEYEVIDLRKSGFRVGSDLNNYIIGFTEYKNLTSNVRICSNIQDGSQFVTLPFKNASMGTSYIVGSLSDKNIYVNPIFRYNDTKLFLFNDVKLNIGEIKFNVVSEATFNTRLILEIPISFRISESKIIYVRDQEQPDLPSEVISRVRDKKIEDILDGEKK